MPLFTCADVKYSYDGNSKKSKLCLNGIDLTVPQGCVFGIIGPNGSGKSTLLKSLYKSIQISSGDIAFIGKDINSYTTRNLAKKLAVVIQSENASIPLTIREYVRLGRAVYHTVFEGYSRLDETIVDDALTQLGLQYIQHRPITGISGGEYQRSMLARAFAQQTDVVLLDEPTNHLDVYHQHRILQTVRDKSVSAVVVLHDLNLATRYCDFLAVLDDGKVIDCGTPEEVLRPDLIKKVYHMSAKRIILSDTIQLVLEPLDD